MKTIKTTVFLIGFLFINSVQASQGLKGEYSILNDPQVKLTRTDPQVNFYWGYGSPNPVIPADNFSVRWTGKLTPKFSETYTLYTRSDDGVKLWIDNSLVINNWSYHSLTENSCKISLIAGQQYDIRLEYFEGWWSAQIQLLWSSPSQPKEIIPQSQLSIPDASPQQPTQPVSGPGGSNYAHASVKKSGFNLGTDLEYWLFEPQYPSLGVAPVIVFLHGFGGLTTQYNEAWINHLVRRGNVVIWPIFQPSYITWPTQYLPNVIGAVKLGIQQLKKDWWLGRPWPDESRFAIVGHSLGGALAASVAARARDEGLPVFKSVMCVAPGAALFEDIIIGDLSKIPNGTLLLTISGIDDNVTGDKWAMPIFDRATNVASKDKNYIYVISDLHGAPALSSDHLDPCGTLPSQNHDQRVDAHDYYGYWKWLDGLTDAAFYGNNREFALGNTPEQRFMGKWSDGIPVVESIVVSHGTIVSNFPNTGEMPAWSPVNANQIAYCLKGVDGYYNIYLANADGTNQKSLTKDQPQLPHKHKGAPMWHPSGKYISFVVEKEVHPGSSYEAIPGFGAYNDIWVITSDGAQAFQLTNVPNDYDHGSLPAHFSADGKKMTWTERIEQPNFLDPKKTFGCWVLKVADFDIINGIPTLANIQTIQPGERTYYEGYGFTPDGKRLLFQSCMGQTSVWDSDIFTVDTASGRDIQPLTNEKYNEHAFYTPDGRSIVWMTDWQSTKGGTDWWIMNSDGTAKRRLTYFNEPFSPQYAGKAVWAGYGSFRPDGKRFVGGLQLDLFTQEGKSVFVDMPTTP